MHPLIPQTHQEAVAEALTQVFGPRHVIETAEALRGGQSGAHVVRLSVGGHACVLRLETAPHPMTDPAAHAACLEAAARAGLAPPLRYAAPDGSLMIMDFIAHRPLAGFARGRAALIAEAGERLAALQALPAFAPAQRSCLDAAEVFIAEFEATRLLSPEAIGEHLFRFRQMREVWPADPGAAAAHNDLNPGNVLCDGERLWFVDWAVAATNDPFGDPACLANTLGVTPEEEAGMLAAWLGREADVREAARFHLMRQVWPMVQAMLILKGVAQQRPDLASPAPFLLARSLSAVQADIGAGRLDMTSPEGRFEYGKALLDELLAGLRGPRFGTSLHRLAA